MIIHHSTFLTTLSLLFLISISLLSCCATTEAVKNEHDEHSHNSNNLRRSTTTNNSKIDLDLHLLSAFRSKHYLKPNVELEIHDLSKTNFFSLKGKKFSIDNLTPMDIYSDGATFTLDDEEMMPLRNEESSVFIGKQGIDTILVSREGGSQGDILSITILGDNGPDVYLESIAPGILITMKPEDVLPDYVDVLEKLEVKGITVKKYDSDKISGIEEKGLYLNTTAATTNDNTVISIPHEDTNIISDKRALSSLGTCNDFFLIDVAAVFDKTFCDSENSKWGRAKSRIEALVAEASNHFQKQGVCTKVRLSKLEGHCKNDPYAEIVNNSPNIGCSGGQKGILMKFANYWKTNKQSVSRTVGHFFFAKKLNENYIGCAYIDQLCSLGQGYGVSNLNFYTGNGMRGILFAHEIGHNIGLNHVTSSHVNPKWIMRPNPGQGGGWHAWSPLSIKNSRILLNTWVNPPYSCIKEQPNS